MLYLHGGKMRLVFHLKEPGPPEAGIDIVVLPAPFSTKRRESCSWIKPLSTATDLSNATNDTRVYYYDYHLESSNVSLWQQLLDHGYLFLKHLADVRNSTALQRRPILFIAHSLGGMVLKRALCLANQNQSAIEHALCGIIFLGCPHLSSTKDARWSKWPYIMKLQSKNVPRTDLSDLDIANLAAACHDFHDLNLQCPILSIYEGLEHKVKENMLDAIRRRNKTLFVDEAHARVGAKNEDLVKIDSSHEDLTRVPVDGLLFDIIVKFFKMVSEEGPSSVAWMFKQTQLEESTIQSNSTPFWPNDHEVPDDELATEFVTNDDGADSNGLLLHESDKARVVKRLPVYLLRGVTRNPAFMGHENILKEMDRVLLAKEDERSSLGCLRAFALCGLGGIGKTELASQYAHTRKLEFDAVFWVNAETYFSLSSGYKDISTQLGLEDGSHGLPDEVVTREIVKGWLCKPWKLSSSANDKQPSEAKWLLIFDNVDDEDMLSDWWPDTATGSIIVTSRDPITKENPFTSKVGLDVPPLTDTEGGDLLHFLSRAPTSKDGTRVAQQISELLGGIPLALLQMGSVIRRNRYTLQEFMKLYTESAGKYQAMHHSEARITYQHTLSTVWATESLPPSALALLQVLSIMDAARIQEELLTKGAKHVNMTDYPTTLEKYVDARYQLLRTSLISRGAEGELKIHRLVQDVIREKMTAGRFEETLNAATTLVRDIWPLTTISSRNQAWRYPIFDTYLPHITRWAKIYASSIEDGRIKPSLDTAVIFNDAAWSIIERSMVEDSRSLLLGVVMAILDHMNRTGEPELEKSISRQRGYCLHYKAFTAQDNGDGPGSVRLIKDAISVVIDRVTRWGDASDAMDLADIYNSSGCLEIMVDDTDKAIEDWKLAYDGFQNTIDTDAFGPTWPAISLAAIYCIKQQPDKAEEFLGPVLKERERRLGRDDKTSSETGAQWRLMGHIRNQQGRWVEGLHFHERALANLVATRGENHYETGDCCYNLAQDQLQKEQINEASDFLDRAITIYNSISPRDENLARALWKKGRVLQKQKRNLEASAYLGRAMKLREKIVPADDRPEDVLEDQDWDRLLYYFSV